MSSPPSAASTKDLASYEGGGFGRRSLSWIPRVLTPVVTARVAAAKRARILTIFLNVRRGEPGFARVDTASAIAYISGPS
jgi:hypothetical protein